MRFISRIKAHLLGPHTASMLESSTRVLENHNWFLEAIARRTASPEDMKKMIRISNSLIQVNKKFLKEVL